MPNNLGLKIISATLIICFASTVFAHNKNNKTVLITGGLSGLGKEMSLAFQQDGWEVWATSRNPEKYPSIAGVKVRKLDLTNQDEIKHLITEIKKSSGHLDVLVNNGGYGILGPQEAISVEQARDIFNVNVLGPLQLIQESLPLMRAKNNGHIINISSTSGLRALPGLGIYAASKMALEGISEAMAAEVAPWNISISIIEPGTVNNDWAKNAPTADKLNNYPGYKNFTNKLRKTLVTKALEIGQNQQEIAQLALTVAKSNKPNLRYQTNQQATSVANEVLSDPTGNLMRDKMITFANQFYDAPRVIAKRKR